MKSSIAFATSVLLACLAAPAFAQSSKAGAQDSAVERAKKRCEENHGVDCSTREGLKEWVNEERPMSTEMQRSAAAARLRRENCAKTKNGTGC